jgi:hypothetical protein
MVMVWGASLLSTCTWTAVRTGRTITTERKLEEDSTDLGPQQDKFNPNFDPNNVLEIATTTTSGMHTIHIDTKHHLHDRIYILTTQMRGLKPAYVGIAILYGWSCSGTPAFCHEVARPKPV